MRYIFNGVEHIDELELEAVTGWCKKTQQAYRSQRKLPYLKIGAKIWYQLEKIYALANKFEAKSA
jgi:hypothetical protein